MVTHEISSKTFDTLSLSLVFNFTGSGLYQSWNTYCLYCLNQALKFYFKISFVWLFPCHLPQNGPSLINGPCMQRYGLLCMVQSSLKFAFTSRIRVSTFASSCNLSHIDNYTRYGLIYMIDRLSTIKHKCYFSL